MEQDPMLTGEVSRSGMEWYPVKRQLREAYVELGALWACMRVQWRLEMLEVVLQIRYVRCVLFMFRRSLC